MSETKAKKISDVRRRGENFRCGAIRFDFFQNLIKSVKKLHPN